MQAIGTNPERIPTTEENMSKLGIETKFNLFEAK